MNNSKKTVRQDKKPVLKANNNNQSGISNAIKVWIGVGIVAFIAIVAVICYDTFHQDTLVSVNGTDYKLNDIDVMYNVYNQETQTEYMSQMYKQFYNQMGQGNYDYWNQEGVVDQARNGAISAMVQTEVLNLEAAKQKANIKLTKDEKKAIDKQAKDLMSKLSGKRLRKTKFTEAKLVDYLTKQKTADKYKESMINSYKITEDTVKDKVDVKKYNERKVQLIKVDTKTTDANNQKKAIAADKLDTYKTQMETFLTKAKAGDDLSKLLSKDEQKTYTYTETTFLVGQNKIDSKVEKAALNLKKDEVAPTVIEGDDALYIVKMIDTDCKDSYKSALSNEVKSQQTTKFNTELSKLEKTYKVSENLEAINALKIGEITLKKGEELTEFATDKEEAKATATPAPKKDSKK